MNRFKCYTLEEINNLAKSKSDFFKDLKVTFDFALPQNWLWDFSKWCKKNYPIIDYQTILFTTVWAYPKNYRLNGLPISFCKEVIDAIREWRNSL